MLLNLTFFLNRAKFDTNTILDSTVQVSAVFEWYESMGKCIKKNWIARRVPKSLLPMGSFCLGFLADETGKVLFICKSIYNRLLIIANVVYHDGIK